VSCVALSECVSASVWCPVVLEYSRVWCVLVVFYAYVLMTICMIVCMRYVQLMHIVINTDA